MSSVGGMTAVDNTVLTVYSTAKVREAVPHLSNAAMPETLRHRLGQTVQADLVTLMRGNASNFWPSLITGAEVSIESGTHSRVALKGRHGNSRHRRCQQRSKAAF
jgi:hypothetical protein